MAHSLLYTFVMTRPTQSTQLHALAVYQLRAKFDRAMRTMDTRFTGSDLAWFRSPLSAQEGGR